MRLFQNTPIQRKLTLSMMLTGGAVALLTCLAFFVVDAFSIRKSTIRQLTTQADIVAANSTAALAFDNADDAREVLAALRAEPHIEAAALYDSDGRVFAWYPSSLAATELPVSPKAGEQMEVSKSFAVVRPVVQDGRQLGLLYLRSDQGAIYERFRLYGLIALVINFGVFAVAYGLARWLRGRIAGPILSLAETAQSVSSRRDYSVRAVRQDNDEIGHLTDAFNQMLGQIELQHAEINGLNRGLEQRVRQRTAQLEAANQELEAFSYSISHDLRAPLRHIDGYAQLLRKRAQAKLDQQECHYLQTICDSATGLGRLIDELLAFSRLGRTEFHLQTVDMQALVGHTLKELETETDGREVRWEIGVLPAVPADGTVIRQVWRNLLANAVKYTRGRAPAVIEISHRVGDGDQHVFSVRDNGAGFDMKYVAKLFGVFQRLHSAAEFEGTGIGLAHVQRIIQRHGGRVWAEGQVGSGAVFHFSLPRSVVPLTGKINLNPANS